MKPKKTTYLALISNGIFSLVDGLCLTVKHLKDATKKRKPIGIENPAYFTQETGIVTTEYPYESIPVPDNGRYRLNNEIDDCIVCDLCAKICPVNCIDIVPIKSPEEIGKTSDGTTKRIYAATFDIDMAKCCYCGLCTTVCPTECLTMTKTYDFSEFDVRNMTYHFTDLSPEMAVEKKKLQEAAEIEKQRLKEVAAAQKTTELPTDASKSTTKPSFKPVIKAAPKAVEEGEERKDQNSEGENKPKPVFKPVIKPLVKSADIPPVENSAEFKSEEKPKPKPVFKPIIKKPPTKEE